jgi:hypothetical protein
MLPAGTADIDVEPLPDYKQLGHAELEGRTLLSASTDGSYGSTPPSGSYGAFEELGCSEAGVPG